MGDLRARTGLIPPLPGKLTLLHLHQLDGIALRDQVLVLIEDF